MANPETESSTPNTALECFSKVLHDQQLCDVTFLVGPSKEQIRAHKIFLIARSDVLRANFSDKWEAKDTVELPLFHPAAFRSFLRFIYSDEVDLEETDWMSLLEIAHFFLVKPLENICVDIGLRDACSDINKALQAFQTARFYDQKKLMTKIGDFMARSFIALSKTENFKEKVDDETLVYLLGLDHLRVSESELFKIIMSVAEARASRKDADDGAVTVASEMKTFLPLIRIPVMTLDEFRTVVDESGVLPPEDVVKFYRFFTARNAAEKQAIASTLTYSDVERRCSLFLNFYYTTLTPLPEIRARFSPEHGLKLVDYVSFFPVMTIFPVQPEETPIMPFCGTKGVAITSITVQCPALLQGALERKESLHCRIEIHQGDQYNIDAYPNSQLCSKIKTTADVMSNDLTEVPIEPPLALPGGYGQIGLRISAEIIAPTFKNIKGPECVIVQLPQRFCSVQVGDFCTQEILLTNIKNRQKVCDGEGWQLITGIQIRAL